MDKPRSEYLASRCVFCFSRDSDVGVPVHVFRKEVEDCAGVLSLENDASGDV